MMIKVKSCARCGKDHEVEMFSLDKHPDYNHWAMCPNKNQPILINVVNYRECECGGTSFSRYGHGSITELVSVTTEGKIIYDEQEVSMKKWYKCSCGREMPDEWLL